MSRYCYRGCHAETAEDCHNPAYSAMGDLSGPCPCACHQSALTGDPATNALRRIIEPLMDAGIMEQDAADLLADLATIDGKPRIRAGFREGWQIVGRMRG